MDRFVFIGVIISMIIITSCRKTNQHLVEKQSPDFEWSALWIAPKIQSDTINLWNCYRKAFSFDSINNKSVTARIAVDTKYWLWINGELVIFEGGLKRGPNPDDSYYDVLDLSKNLKNGHNDLVLLSWYFGKEGFSHKDSGRHGLLMQIEGTNLNISSDETWKAWQHPAFGMTAPPHPNYRLPESNIRFDARKGNFNFIENSFVTDSLPLAIALGEPFSAPWGKLVERPIPQWKDFGLRSYQNEMTFPFISKGDTLKMQLPYNAQVTPYLKIETDAGKTIDIRTDNYTGGGAPNVRAEYVTTKGLQSYENFGWMNGHSVFYHIPEGVKVWDLKYRETGYDTEFAGSITVDDDFYNELCKKAVRTLYVTMRDTYMDTPGRERAQWWGDVVLESGEAFYALSRSSDALMRKGILELVNWQRADSTIFSPVPAGNWDKELPGQMLMSIGKYGFWNYYLHTGDIETIRKIHPAVKKYLSLWAVNDQGTVDIRKGGWTWGDWGDNKDVPLLMNTQYYLALEGYQKMSEALGKTEEVDSVNSLMTNFKAAFNERFWKGDHYRSPSYDGETDDRSQGLAVVANLADRDKYNALYEVFRNEKHASPYMEKYVLEALFQMDRPEYALVRMKERFSKMVLDSTYSTLWEGWGIGAEGYGGGTTNHAWSGGGLTLLYQYAAGIAPTSPNWETFRVKPQPGFLKHIAATVQTVKGVVKLEVLNEKKYQLTLEVPEGTKAEVYIPSGFQEVTVNGKNEKYAEEGDFKVFELPAGKYLFEGN